MGPPLLKFLAMPLLLVLQLNDFLVMKKSKRYGLSDIKSLWNVIVFERQSIVITV